MEQPKNCTCRTCEYGRKIMAIADKQVDPNDKREIEDLYTAFASGEDDNGLYRGRWEATKDILCLIRKEHFRTSDGNTRLDGHENCAICAAFEDMP